MSDTPKVRRIPANRKDPHLIKAGIYVRVSTARVEQLRSLSNQVSAMTRYVYSRENWVLKDIYLEVGSAKTGSSRREFTRLVDDCTKHQIETVVVKSLSRFGRDNVEVIESIRTLINAGVTIYFMEEDIDADANYPEWELSLWSAINQSENEHRSENIKMGLRFRAESGQSGLYRKPCYGYTKGEDGNLEINQEQAEVVKRIYNLYLEGLSFVSIIDKLAREKVPSPQGKEKWSKRAIETVLSNIKYTGNVKILNNDPDGRSYMLQDCHPAIISADKYDKVQEEIMKRSRRKKSNERVTLSRLQEISWPVSPRRDRKVLHEEEINWPEPAHDRKD